MNVQMVCLDLEGVLVPEIWVNVAERTGLDALRRTTRDEPDYDILMRYRLDILAREGLALPLIQEVIGQLQPLDGAREFLDDLRRHYQVVILSDTFYEFATPLMRQLAWPTLFCHRLEVSDDQRLTGYRLRLPNHKQAAVAAFKKLNFRTTAVGDSYNDISMLGEAHTGILFHAPAHVIAEYPQFTVAEHYDQLRAAIDRSAS